MTDDIHNQINNKVISLFQRHRRGEHFHFTVDEGGEMVISPDGFNYVTFRQDDAHQTEMLKEVAKTRHYIVKMLEEHRDTARLNNYHIPGELLDEFLKSLSQRPGRILEIKQFLPDTMA